jgi:hypothetical protein
LRRAIRKAADRRAVAGVGRRQPVVGLVIPRSAGAHLVAANDALAHGVACGRDARAGLHRCRLRDVLPADCEHRSGQRYRGDLPRFPCSPSPGVGCFSEKA